jgi:hypothetical protein
VHSIAVLPSLSIVTGLRHQAASIEANWGDARELGTAHARTLDVIACDDTSRDDMWRLPVPDVER